MKKITGYLLMIMLITCMLISASGCGNTSGGGESSGSSGDDAYDTDDAGDAGDENGSGADDAESADLIEEDEMDVDLLFYEDENFTVRGTHFEIDEYGTVTMAVEVENYSDEDWFISIQTAEINNLETNVITVVDTDAGETKEANVYMEYLGAFTGLSEITYAAIEFQAVNGSYTESFYEYAYAYMDGEENAVDYTRESLPTDVILIDTDDVRVTMTGVMMDLDDYIYINLYVENKGTTDFITISSGSEVVNGVSLDGLTDARLIEYCVRLGNSCYARLEIDPDAAGISSPEDVETAEFKLILEGVVGTIYNEWNSSTDGDTVFRISDSYSLEFQA